MKQNNSRKNVGYVILGAILGVSLIINSILFYLSNTEPVVTLPIPLHINVTWMDSEHVLFEDNKGTSKILEYNQTLDMGDMLNYDYKLYYTRTRIVETYGKYWEITIQTGAK